ncbi:MAG: HDOD domain-containing protein [Planctomycetes bacterium]|nr:HDOD domain-containing protein [Planctomycetota bacterium]
MGLNLSRLVREIRELPTLPQVAVQIFNSLEDPRSSARDIERIMSNDPSLAGKVLRMVNSAYFGFPHRISDLGHAIVILGFAEVKALALSMSIIDLFGKTEGGAEAFDKTRFWRHSVAVANVARDEARRRGADAGVAFVTGLLHDIGKLVMDQYAPQDLGRICERSEADGCTYWQAERALAVVPDHAEVAGLLVENWRLADEVVEAVRYHHEPASAPASVYVALVRLGNHVAGDLDLLASGDHAGHPLDEDTRALLRLEEDQIPGIAGRLKQRIEAIDVFVDLTR